MPKEFHEKAKQFKEEDVINCSVSGSQELFKEDISLKICYVNFAMGKNNPFEQVKFYIPNNYQECHYVD